MSFLDNDTFKSIVAATPLVSIDLIIEDLEGNVLLGLRNNRPAQGYWFVPGGRILKNETLDDAFRRLTQEELGCVFERSQAHFHGVYEHLYKDSVFGEQPSTHYVVLAYRLRVNPEDLHLPMAQHHGYQWWEVGAIRGSRQVHDNTRAYVL